MNFTMHRRGLFPTGAATVMLLIVSLIGGAQAANKPERADAAPVLLSTKGGGPKWKNLEQLKQLAAKGDPQACFELGTRFTEGDEVDKDASKAVALFEQAARGGVADAWFRLGKMSHDGNGVPQDYGRALEAYTRAAQAGVSEAQHNLGSMLVSGRGVKRDFAEGLAWLIVAAKSGAVSDAEAQVRARLAKRPELVKAAEARAVEIVKDLPTASVRAELKRGAAGDVLVAPAKPAVASTPPVGTAMPVIAVPKVELPAMPVGALPAAPGPAATPAEKR